MYIFYDFSKIKEFEIFSNLDFSGFTNFEIVNTTIQFNIYYLLFLAFIFVIAYKLFNRLWNFIF